MKQYLISILLCYVFGLNEAGWVLVWQDDFDRNGRVDLSKWNFDVGGSGWGLLISLSISLFIEFFEFRQ